MRREKGKRNCTFWTLRNISIFSLVIHQGHVSFSRDIEPFYLSLELVSEIFHDFCLMILTVKDRSHWAYRPRLRKAEF